ncbi:MAG: hypothetical protein QOD82_1966, partial [Pseudonocardiales bacterium]|nr:hypothetical protein [Pseudonocardiales bacterium]
MIGRPPPGWGSVCGRNGAAG